jgi:hypothetical protein
MKKHIQLEWNVFHHNVNAKKIERYNVFNHSSFYNSVIKIAKNKETFSEDLRKEVMYYFWAKCEMEVVITSWPPYIDAKEYERLTKENNTWIEQRGEPARCLNVCMTVGEKIDIYEQLMLNWDKFVEYTWNTLNT